MDSESNVVSLEQYKTLKSFMDNHNSPEQRDVLRRYALKEFRRAVAPILLALGKDRSFINKLAGAYAEVAVQDEIKNVSEVLDKLKKP